jgi:uncharacterized damage-inducible protein DinB
MEGWKVNLPAFQPSTLPTLITTEAKMNQSSERQLLFTVLDGYEPEIGRWLAAMEDTRQRTKERLEGMDGKILNWAAPQSDNNIGTLLYHIAAIEADWLYADILEGQAFPSEVDILLPYAVRDDHGKLMEVAGESLADHLHRLDTIRRCFLEALQGMSLDDFRRTRQLPNYDTTPEWVLHHLMQHEAEHRGQIGELRLMAERALKM